MEENGMSYAEKLARMLAGSGWSQEELARKLEVSFVSLNGWLHGKSEPRREAKEKIDFMATEVLGEGAVDTAELKRLKKHAVSRKCTAGKIIDNRGVLEKITTSLTYHNNATEGSTMTESDVRAVVYENQALRNRTAVEQREAINHQAALYFLLDELRERGGEFRITPELIRATHLRMMNGVISDAGVYRNHAVRIRGAAVPLANFIKIPELLQGWCNFVNSETTDPIGLLAQSHAAFEKIHPFSDGNGRTGRLLLFILSLKLGLTPPILKRERRVAYYKYLELAQTREVFDPLEKFLAVSILETAELIDHLS